MTSLSSESRRCKLKLGQSEIEVSDLSISISQENSRSFTFAGGGPELIPGPVTWSCDFVTAVNGPVRLQTLMEAFSSHRPVSFEIEVGLGRKFSGQAYIDGDLTIGSSGEVEVQLVGTNVLNLSVGGESIGIGQPIRVDRGIYEAVHKQATELLLMFLDKGQNEQFKESGVFSYVDNQNRYWHFYRRFHYPVTVEEFLGKETKRVGAVFMPTRLCFETRSDMPIEDLLLLAFLEVKGGRGDELIRIGTGAEVNNGN